MTASLPPGFGRPSDWAGLVVYCAGMSWDSPTGTDKQMAERLSHIVPVLYVDPPVSVLAQVRRRDFGRAVPEHGLRLIGDRLARLTPLAPPGVSRPGLRELALRATRVSMRRATRRLGGDVEAVVVASLDDLFFACGERQRVLYATDDYVAGAELMGVSRAWLLGREAAQLAAATTVVSISHGLADRWRIQHPTVHVVPNGCDVDAYSAQVIVPAPSDIRLPAPIAGLVGHISDRLDLAVLEAIADQGDSLLIIGPTTPALDQDRFARLTARPTVQWLGARPYTELPAYLREIKVGITPYVDNDFNRMSFPLKTLEYLAAGTGVVTSDLPAARWLDTDLITIAATPSSFAADVHAALDADEGDDLADRRRAFAAEHSWDSRARDFARILRISTG